jgi:hypothetical protein
MVVGLSVRLFFSITSIHHFGNLRLRRRPASHQPDLLRASQAVFQADQVEEVEVAAAGDAMAQFTVNGAMTHTIGIDNTDDRFKITPNSATPGGNADMGISVRDNAGLGNTGINIDFPTFPLTVKGRARLEEFIGEGNLYAAGNLAFGNGAGTAPTLTTIVGTNNMVMVRFTTGTTPTANGDIFTITYPLAFPNKTGVTFSAGCDGASAVAGDNAATDHNKFKISQSITNNFIFKAVGTLSASTAYAFTFQINGY